jgi:hypothetical protein
VFSQTLKGKNQTQNKVLKNQNKKKKPGDDSMIPSNK